MRGIAIVDMGASGRGLYRHAELRRLLHPASIAVLGASVREGSFGLRTLNNLEAFPGAVYPVNEKYERIGRHRCYAGLADLPAAPDCAVLALPREGVEQAVAACIEAGVGGVIVYASGYAETGRTDLIALERRLGEQVRGTATRLLGPNCLGMANYACGARALFGRMPELYPLAQRSIGVIAQSGSVAMSLAQAIERGVSISHAIPSGNGADVGIGDLIAYLADDPACQAIACVFEGVSDAGHLVEAARLCLERDKPLIVYKMAVTGEGAAAALSHTGALAGSAGAYRAVLQEAGAVMIDQLDDVIETAAFFAKAGRPKGRGAAIVLGSGGLGVMAADKAEQHGVPLPQPQGRTLEILRASVPEFGAARNPCDVTAQALNGPDAMEACADAMLADAAYGTLMVVHPYADAFGTARIALWKRLAQKHGKIVCNYWSTESLVGPGAVELEAEPGIATFRSLDRCFAALSAWHAREARRQHAGRRAQRFTGAAEREAAGELLVGMNRRSVNRDLRRNLSEREAKQVLALYGIPVVPEMLVASADEAADAAARLGLVAVLKLESPDVPHKTEAGVVRLGLRTEQEVRAAYEDIMRKAANLNPRPRVAGVLVQPMAPAGVEVLVGSVSDPVFGPLLVVGLGGVLVELLRDTAMAPPPVDMDKALELLRSLKGARLLEGYRGAKPVSLRRLAELICRVSEFVADHAELVEEVDINPIICNGDAMVAVDALIALRTGGEA
jgi:acetyl-CoA synthetase